MKIIQGTKPNIRCFHQLAIEQPFENELGELCIKLSHTSCIRLADSEGNTFSSYFSDVEQDSEVKALPMVKKWEW